MHVGDNLTLWPFKKALEIYDVVTQFYDSSKSSFPKRWWLSILLTVTWAVNILIDCTTGAITGIIDWEMAGFCPAWLAAISMGWFNDDTEWFFVTDDQDTHNNYAGSTPGDLRAGARFWLAFVELDEDLLWHHLQGVVLRVLFYNCCNTYVGNTEVWLEKYIDNEWSVNQRGPFPFDFWVWINAGFDLQTRFIIHIHLVSSHWVTSSCLEWARIYGGNWWCLGLAWELWLWPGFWQVRLSEFSGQGWAINDNWLWLGPDPSHSPNMQNVKDTVY